MSLRLLTAIEKATAELSSPDKHPDFSSNNGTPTAPGSALFKANEHGFLHSKPLPSTPSMRTGPPRTVSYIYSGPSTPIASRRNSKLNSSGLPGDIATTDGDGTEYPFSRTSSDFRGALEVGSSFSSEKKGKKRESRFLDDSWNPMRWFHESPKEEKSGFDFPRQQDGDDVAGPHSAYPRDDEKESKPKPLRRAYSDPHSQDKPKPVGKIKWNRLRSLIPNVVSNAHTALNATSAVTPNTVNITDELISGGLSTLMLRLWFERDEKGHRRIPVLLHRLRIRVSDSLHPLHGKQSVFRIECEYANGAARWVVYRQLRDFLSLHAHYSLSNAYNRNVDNLPEFPRTSNAQPSH